MTMEDAIEVLAQEDKQDLIEMLAEVAVGTMTAEDVKAYVASMTEDDE